MIRIIKKFISLNLLCFLTVNTCVFYELHEAEAVSVATGVLQIPSQFGVITEKYIPENFSSDTPQVILIQDAHISYEAQKNISQIVKFLVEEKGIKLVCEEGDEGTVDPEILFNEKNKSVREAVADFFMKNGLVAGVEMERIMNDDFILYGVENRELYEKNLRQLKTVFEQEESTRNILAPVFEAIYGLQKKTLSQIAYQLVENQRKFIKGEINTDEYFAFLIVIAEKNKLLDNYPNIKKLKTEKFNVKCLLKEATSLFNDLIQILVKDLKSHEYIKAEEHFMKLINLSEACIKREDYKEFKVFKKECLLRNEYYLEQLNIKNSDLILNKINLLIQAPELFYEDAVNREKFLVNNTLAKLEVQQQGKYRTSAKVVLVAGGFHAEGILNRLKEKKVAYIVVKPNVEIINEGMSNVYRLSMLGKLDFGDMIRNSFAILGQNFVDGALVSSVRVHTLLAQRNSLYDKYDLGLQKQIVNIVVMRNKNLGKDSINDLEQWRDSLREELKVDGLDSEDLYYKSHLLAILDEVNDGKECLAWIRENINLKDEVWERYSAMMDKEKTIKAEYALTKLYSVLQGYYLRELIYSKKMNLNEFSNEIKPSYAMLKLYCRGAQSIPKEIEVEIERYFKEKKCLRDRGVFERVVLSNSLNIKVDEFKKLLNLLGGDGAPEVLYEIINNEEKRNDLVCELLDKKRFKEEQQAFIEEVIQGFISGNISCVDAYKKIQGMFLRELINSKKMNMREFADKTNVPYNSLKKFSRGLWFISEDLAEKWEGYFGVDKILRDGKVFCLGLPEQKNKELKELKKLLTLLGGRLDEKSFLENIDDSEKRSSFVRGVLSEKTFADGLQDFVEEVMQEFERENISCTDAYKKIQGVFLRELIYSKKLNLKKFANETQVSYSKMLCYCRGEYLLPEALVEKFEGYFGVDRILRDRNIFSLGLPKEKDKELKSLLKLLGEQIDEKVLPEIVKSSEKCSSFMQRLLREKTFNGEQQVFIEQVIQEFMNDNLSYSNAYKKLQGHYLKELVCSKKMNLVEFADKVQASYEMMLYYCRGEYPIPEALIEKCEQYFGNDECLRDGNAFLKVILGDELLRFENLLLLLGEEVDSVVLDEVFKNEKKRKNLIEKVLKRKKDSIDQQVCVEEVMQDYMKNSIFYADAYKKIQGYYLRKLVYSGKGSLKKFADEMQVSYAMVLLYCKGEFSIPEVLVEKFENYFGIERCLRDGNVFRYKALKVISNAHILDFMDRKIDLLEGELELNNLFSLDVFGKWFDAIEVPEGLDEKEIEKLNKIPNPAPEAQPFLSMRVQNEEGSPIGYVCIRPGEKGLIYEEEIQTKYRYLQEDGYFDDFRDMAKKFCVEFRIGEKKLVVAKRCETVFFTYAPFVYYRNLLLYGLNNSLVVFSRTLEELRQTAEENSYEVDDGAFENSVCEYLRDAGMVKSHVVLSCHRLYKFYHEEYDVKIDKLFFEYKEKSNNSFEAFCKTYEDLLSRSGAANLTPSLLQNTLIYCNTNLAQQTAAAYQLYEILNKVTNIKNDFNIEKEKTGDADLALEQLFKIYSANEKIHKLVDESKGTSKLTANNFKNLLHFMGVYSLRSFLIKFTSQGLSREDLDSIFDEIKHDDSFQCLLNFHKEMKKRNIKVSPKNTADFLRIIHGVSIRVENKSWKQLNELYSEMYSVVKNKVRSHPYFFSGLDRESLLKEMLTIMEETNEELGGHELVTFENIRFLVSMFSSVSAFEDGEKYYKLYLKLRDKVEYYPLLYDKNKVSTKKGQFRYSPLRTFYQFCNEVDFVNPCDLRNLLYLLGYNVPPITIYNKFLKCIKQGIDFDEMGRMSASHYRHAEEAWLLVLEKGLDKSINRNDVTRILSGLGYSTYGVDLVLKYSEFLKNNFESAEKIFDKEFVSGDNILKVLQRTHLQINLFIQEHKELSDAAGIKPITFPALENLLQFKGVKGVQRKGMAAALDDYYLCLEKPINIPEVFKKFTEDSQGDMLAAFDNLIEFLYDIYPHRFLQPSVIEQVLLSYGEKTFWISSGYKINKSLKVQGIDIVAIYDELKLLYTNEKSLISAIYKKIIESNAVIPSQYKASFCMYLANCLALRNKIGMDDKFLNDDLSSFEVDIEAAPGSAVGNRPRLETIIRDRNAEPFMAKDFISELKNAFYKYEEEGETAFFIFYDVITEEKKIEDVLEESEISWDEYEDYYSYIIEKVLEEMEISSKDIFEKLGIPQEEDGKSASPAVSQKGNVGISSVSVLQSDDFLHKEIILCHILKADIDVEVVSKLLEDSELEIYVVIEKANWEQESEEKRQNCLAETTKLKQRFSDRFKYVITNSLFSEFVHKCYEIDENANYYIITDAKIAWKIGLDGFVKKFCVNYGKNLEWHFSPYTIMPFALAGESAKVMLKEIKDKTFVIDTSSFVGKKTDRDFLRDSMRLFSMGLCDDMLKLRKEQLLEIAA